MAAQVAIKQRDNGFRDKFERYIAKDRSDKDLRRKALTAVAAKVARKHMYRWRHLIENYFAKIKEFRGIATRYDKTDISYAANCNLVATIIAMR